MEARDVLADDVELRRPSLREGRVGESRRRQVVGKRIEPDVGRLPFPGGSEHGKGHSPVEPRTARRDVFETLRQKSRDLVASAGRLNELRMPLDVLFQKLLISAEPEEPVPFLDPLEGARWV